MMTWAKRFAGDDADYALGSGIAVDSSGGAAQLWIVRHNMTADKFRSLALNIPGASESAHMGHPDFRLEGRVFATLGYPGKNHGMVKLTPSQQKKFVKKAPDVFSPCNGIWGRRGATAVHLASAKVGLIGTALDAARRNVIKK